MAYSPMDHSNTQNPPEIRQEIMNYKITFYYNEHDICLRAIYCNIQKKILINSISDNVVMNECLFTRVERLSDWVCWNHPENKIDDLCAGYIYNYNRHKGQLANEMHRDISWKNTLIFAWHIPYLVEILL